MYNLIKHSDSYSKTLWKYCRDEPNNNMTNSESCKLKSRFLDNSNDTGIKNAEIAVPLTFKRLEGHFDPPYGFWKTVFSKDGVNPWLFETYIIMKHIFPKN